MVHELKQELLDIKAIEDEILRELLHIGEWCITLSLKNLVYANDCVRWDHTRDRFNDRD